MTERPRVTVAAVIEAAGRFLFVEEMASGRLVLNQPAGHVEAGETLEAAVVRETLEESAWRFEPTALVGMYLWGNPGNGRSFLRAVYTGRALGREPGRALDEGIVRTRWLSRTELAAASGRLRSPLVELAVDDYLAGRRHSLDIVNSLLDADRPTVLRTG